MFVKILSQWRRKEGGGGGKFQSLEVRASISHLKIVLISFKLLMRFSELFNCNLAKGFFYNLHSLIQRNDWYENKK